MSDARINDSFCALPWLQLNFSMDGSAQICCRASGSVSDEKGALRLDHTPFTEIWNSPHMVSVRKAMVEGRRIRDCATCYTHERSMGTSMRVESNAMWLRNVPESEYEPSFRQLKAASESTGHVLGRSPVALHLWLGSQCNLKCRMCRADCSSTIAADPVHSHWHPLTVAEGDLRGPRRFQDGRTWADSPSVLFEDVFKEPNVIEAISFAGGEPLLQPQIHPLLQLLIDRGRASSMTLYFSTNGTIFSPALVEKLQRFREVTLAVSMDGMGALNDYIRHPARWSHVTENIRRMRELPWLRVEIEPTLQAYNALKITDLLRFCDDQGLGYTLSNVLVHPNYLSFSALPDNCRRLARERLEAYGRTCPEDRRAALAAVVRHLEGPPPPEQPKLIETFMQFTNDLDVSRSERIATAEPELVQLLAEAGWPWPAADAHTSVVPHSGR